jgi:hypothetical protein
VHDVTVGDYADVETVRAELTLRGSTATVRASSLERFSGVGLARTPLDT